MLTRDELLTQTIDEVCELTIDNRKLREQIREMQILIDKANAQLQKGNIPNVMGCLQEKKKLIEKQKELDIENRDSKGVRRTGDYDYYCGCIERDIMAIEALEEIINKNSP